jgi:hypothetical protein
VAAELCMHLNDVFHDVNSLYWFSLVKVFIEKDTALPSGGPVEHMFSPGGQILTPHRNSLLIILSSSCLFRLTDTCVTNESLTIWVDQLN